MKNSRKRATEVDFQQLLDDILPQVGPFLKEGKGRVADYIPELSCVSPGKFGMAIHTVDGNVFKVGDADENFSIQ
ncbi:MAG: glutaminase, partial [Desulfopila sp.]|nr:glutaminase [Desulfopila sp.]